MAEGRVTSATESPTKSNPELPVLPTLLGEGYGTYRQKPQAFMASFFVNILLYAGLIWVGHWAVIHRQEIKQQFTGAIDISPYILPSSKTESGGGGGGGERDPLQASRGALPKQARTQITPPQVIQRNPDPALPVPPTVVAPPMQAPNLAALGDPLSKIAGPPSSGTGSGGGIGSGSGGGVGSGTGAGVGPGFGGGVGGGYYKVGGGVSAPVALFAPDPEYSEEARKAKFQGTVVLVVVVGADGRPRDIRVARSLGLGLDEKAVEAVKNWKFTPGKKDGTAVAVQVSIEVSFHLY